MVSFSSFGQVLLKEIKSFYQKDSITTVDIPLFQEMFLQKYKKKSSDYESWFNLITDVPVNNIAEYIVSMRKEDILERMATTAGSGRAEETLKLANELKNISVNAVEEDYTIYTGYDVGQFLDRHKPENLIKVYPLGHEKDGSRSLNDHLDGGIPKGVNTNILVFAETEVGKSMFSINMAYGFCKQNMKVMYIGNEDPEERMLIRFLSRFASSYSKNDMWTKTRMIREGTKKAINLANDNGYENFSFVPLAPGTLSDLECLMEKDIDALFIDQMRNIEIEGNEGESQVMAKVSKTIRKLGKQKGIPVISVSQANDHSGLVLDKSNLYMSKVATPGDLDLMLGIGMNDDYASTNHRMISICKNKVSAWLGHFPVKLIPEINMVMAAQR